MSWRLRDHATYDDLMLISDSMVAELIGGELYASPRPAGPHTLAASALGAILVPPFQFGESGRGGWWILDEPELHFGDNVLVPDLAGWRCDRMPEIPRNHVFSVVPDWVCEVISPSTGRLDRLKKMPIYARVGVRYAWIIDPILQVLELRTLQKGQWQIRDIGGEEPARIPPFEDIEIDLTRVWGPTPVS